MPFPMTELLANQDETLVHVVDPTGSGEYTFCGLEITEGGADPCVHPGSSLHPVSNRLPNCLECKEHIRQLKDAIRGIRFSKQLKSFYEEN